MGAVQRSWGSCEDGAAKRAGNPGIMVGRRTGLDDDLDDARGPVTAGSRRGRARADPPNLPAYEGCENAVR